MAVTDITEIANMTRSSETSQRALPNSPLHADLPSTAELLIEGGDARIALGADGITNKYGCTPFPDAGLLSFGSSTASVISASSFDAASRLRDQLAVALATEPADRINARDLERIRPELKT